jgi:hypothetical protein
MIRAYNLGTGLQWPNLWRAYALRSSRPHCPPDELDFGRAPLLPFCHTRMDFSLDSFYPPCLWFYSIFISSSFRPSTEIMHAIRIHVCTT